MNHPPKGYRTFDHDQHARSVAPDDFWGQIRRTVNGRPVPEEQIRMIVDAVISGLDLRSDDVLLDLACGNGALTARLYDSCSASLGVDSSEYLVEVARKNFQRPPTRLFAVGDVADFAAREPDAERFTKALCYGSFSYFSPETAQAVLRLLASRFRNVTRIFIGNLPDRERANAFYASSPPSPGELDDPRSQIGVWRSPDEFRHIALQTGWDCELRHMPRDFYAAHYRYDVVLSRRK